MKTFSAKPADVTRTWYVVDASEVPLGRMATQIAVKLTGKDKPQFTQHIDCGDFVIVINADKLVTTGTKTKDKTYYRYSGFPGGLSERSLEEQVALDSAVVIEKAVKGMLPVNKLRPERLKRLKIYSGSEHSHTAQQPVALSLKEKK
jgi:large subunit ribosomal protein L13